MRLPLVKQQKIQVLEGAQHLVIKPGKKAPSTPAQPPFVERQIHPCGSLEVEELLAKAPRV
jgi:hypothetical protein